MHSKSLIAALSAMAMTGSAFAAESLNPGDQAFLKQAAQGNQAEVMIGKLGLRKSHDPKIRKASQHLISEHGQANAALKKVAYESKVAVPSQLTPQQRTAYNQLSGLKGKAFDQKFVQVGLMAHTKEVKAYESQMEKAHSDKVRDYAASYLPTLQEHKAMLEAIHQGK